MKNIDIISNTDKLELYSDDYPYNLPMKVSGFDDEKMYIKFIKNCERLIRASSEYGEWRRYIKDVLQNNCCLITLEIDDQVTVEIHHHIPSLFTIVKAVVNKYIDLKKEFCSFDICLDVMNLHYSNKVGYVPLIKSMHEKLHSGFLNVPVDLVKGNYIDFLKEYGSYIDDEDWEIIRKRQSIKNSNNNWKNGKYPGLNNNHNILLENDLIKEFDL